ncbi:MAG TPA: hypothetical protein VFI91_10100 [Longimicrobiaceae bacterium]|nr:hypothetical protein [Longimicrobiaceae bacterium]
MSLNAIGGAAAGIQWPTETPKRVETEKGNAAAPTQVPQTPVPELLAPRSPALSVEAPAGTDPELWSVLSAEERTFFAKAGAMGPLTYGHMLRSGGAQTPMMRGGRLDVRV